MKKVITFFLIPIYCFSMTSTAKQRNSSFWLKSISQEMKQILELPNEQMFFDRIEELYSFQEKDYLNSK